MLDRFGHEVTDKFQLQDGRALLMRKTLRSFFWSVALTVALRRSTEAPKLRSAAQDFSRAMGKSSQSGDAEDGLLSWRESLLQKNSIIQGRIRHRAAASVVG